MRFGLSVGYISLGYIHLLIFFVRNLEISRYELRSHCNLRLLRRCFVASPYSSSLSSSTTIDADGDSREELTCIRSREGPTTSVVIPLRRFPGGNVSSRVKYSNSTLKSDLLSP